ncbi:biotin-dependent carboxyltransferase family protein [Tahibacter amnicola]|uniref:Biotin-dependent carboxyltransferase family protein n=1 Tax=Tahibacter amnicola TaxID=2976241 RepID=A0ABY6BJ05_9GAMM|nr:biotin-dependent carboxyltransferase family protein [Tahibacter amnicola]MCU7372918.1 biotin-dependent carboxyltransferase family protein [Paucibacter sp. O1-1]MDA3827914.1 biotin-dependent carboxyltransferase family protein [Paucibacter sp. O1-1]UXI69556.1 biotin-dependent carboxyltransferase family protein [Tahibacter amnicola]
MITVLRPGMQTTVQDSGRNGYAGAGIGSAGSADPVCARLANRLVGNDITAALLEITLTGPTLRFSSDAWIALAGAPLEASINGQPVPTWRPVPLSAGTTLECHGMRQGARTYLAVRGGIAVKPVLGSRSTDVNAAIGPLGGRPLQSGDTLAVAALPDRIGHRTAPRWSCSPSPWFTANVRAPIRLTPGTHYEWLDGASRVALTSHPYRIQPDSNRVGLRLDGPALQLTQPLELISECVCRGTVQLPPAGLPIVLGAEHPTTGGYPRIAHVIEADLPRIAQQRPGDEAVFTLVTPDDAVRAGYRVAGALGRLEAEIDARLAALDLHALALS